MNQKIRTYLPAILIILIAAGILIYQALTKQDVPDDLKQKCRKPQKWAKFDTRTNEGDER